MTLSPACLRAFLLVLLLLLPGPSLLAADLSPAEERGKNLYFSGLSPSGKPILAYFGEDLVEIPGEFATCGSCHGYDGLGRPESGVIPSNITWKYLIKSYGHVHPNGAEHPPFTEASLKDYLRTGTFPGGEAGDPSMPVYEMPEQDLDDLIAFMRHLGTLLDPGLSETAIRVGTLLPAEGRLGEIGMAMRGVIEAYFREINKKGGIYGRSIELATTPLPPHPETASSRIKTLLEGQDLFALVSTFTPESEAEVQSALATEDIPLIGPFTLYPVDSYALSRNTFSILPGLREQIQGLIQYAGNNLPLTAPRVALVYSKAAHLGGVIEGVEQACEKRGWDVAAKLPFTAGTFEANGLVEQSKATRSDLVVFLGVEKELRAFLEAAALKKWSPYVLTPGVLAGRIALDAPESFENRLYLAYPTMTSDRKDWGIAEFSRLMRDNDLPPTHIQARLSAYASAKILVEALRLSGRKLSRRKLVSVLERFYKFETGLTPPITYSPNRRIGAKGAYIVKMDPQLRQEKGAPVSAEWVDLK